MLLHREVLDIGQQKSSIDKCQIIRDPLIDNSYGYIM